MVIFAYKTSLTCLHARIHIYKECINDQLFDAFIEEYFLFFKRKYKRFGYILKYDLLSVSGCTRIIIIIINSNYYSLCNLDLWLMFKNKDNKHLVRNQQAATKILTVKRRCQDAESGPNSPQQTISCLINRHFFSNFKSCFLI